MFTYLYFLTVLTTIGVSVVFGDGQECTCSTELNEIAMKRIAQLESIVNEVPVVVNAQMMMIKQHMLTLVGKYEEDIDQMKTAVVSMGNVGGIGDIVGFVSEQMNSTSSSLADMKERMKEQAEALDTIIEEQNKRFEELEEKLKEQEEEKEEESKENDEEESEDDGAVAFFVTDHIEHLYNPPIFTKTLTNIGDGYNGDTGVFSCPVAGIYLFTFSVQTVRHLNSHCQIALNGDIVAYAQTADSYADMASVSAILSLKVGDRITLIECGGWGSAYSSEGTTFGGVLIHKLPKNAKRQLN